MVNIVLVEPEIPQNTGNVVRTCACTGAALHLVHPLGFKITDASLKRAGLDYWDKLNIVEHKSLPDFFNFAKGEAMFFFTTKAEKSFSEVTYPEKVFFLFGKETAGLPRDLLQNNPEKCLRIPMINDIRCLNLSNSVAVAVYEYFRQTGYTSLK